MKKMNRTPLAAAMGAALISTFAAIPAFCSGSVAPTLPGTSTNGITGTWSPAIISNTASATYTFTPAVGSWLRISLKEIPEGKYELFLDVMKEPFGCEISLWQRQTRVTDWLSTYQTTEERSRDMYMGELDIREFKNTLTFRFKTDQQKTGFILNRIKLIRKQ